MLSEFEVKNLKPGDVVIAKDGRRRTVYRVEGLDIWYRASRETRLAAPRKCFYGTIQQFGHRVEKAGG